MAWPNDPNMAEARRRLGRTAENTPIQVPHVWERAGGKALSNSGGALC